MCAAPWELLHENAHDETQQFRSRSALQESCPRTRKRGRLRGQANSIRRVTKIGSDRSAGEVVNVPNHKTAIQEMCFLRGNNKNSEEQRSESKARLKEGGAQNALASVLLLLRVEERLTLYESNDASHTKEHPTNTDNHCTS